MNKLQIASAKTGKIYSYDLQRRVGGKYAVEGDASTRYEEVHFQVNVYADGEWLNFGSVDDESDTAGVLKAVHDVIEWDETPSDVLASMHSRFD